MNKVTEKTHRVLRVMGEVKGKLKPGGLGGHQEGGWEAGKGTGQVEKGGLTRKGAECVCGGCEQALLRPGAI